jgi:hypothetical protein
MFAGKNSDGRRYTIIEMISFLELDCRWGFDKALNHWARHMTA